MPDVDRNHIIDRFENIRSQWLRRHPSRRIFFGILIVGLIAANFAIFKIFDFNFFQVPESIMNRICQSGITTNSNSLNGQLVQKYAPTISALDLEDTNLTATIVISCGTQETDAVQEMQSLIKSILILSSRPIRFVFLTDVEGAKRIRTMFSNLGKTNRPLDVEIHRITDQAIEKFAAKLRYNPNGHHSGRWGTAKLMIPWVLPNIKRAIVLDTDMVLLEDPIRLWKHFNYGKDWAYQIPMPDNTEPSTICSCIVLIDCERARSMRVYPKLMAAALQDSAFWSESEKMYRTPHGDQGLYWLMIRKYPHMFFELPQHWNVDRCHKFKGVFQEGSTSKVSLLHRNCGGGKVLDSNLLSDVANPFFSFFISYKWHWLKAPKGEGYEVVVRTFDHHMYIDDENKT